MSGRGELHLGILIETMRREGFEFQVSAPEVIYKRIDDVLCEPIEHVIVDVPDEHAGIVIQNLGSRKGLMKNMLQAQGNTRLEFNVPARGPAWISLGIHDGNERNRNSSSQFPRV